MSTICTYVLVTQAKVCLNPSLGNMYSAKYMKVNKKQCDCYVMGYSGEVVLPVMSIFLYSFNL